MAAAFSLLLLWAMKLFVAVALVIASWAARAEASCKLPELELIWSYPAAGEGDVPINAELWVLLPYPWGNPVVKLDGREVSYTTSPAAHGVVHVTPGPLEAGHDYVLQLDFRGVRSGEEAPANALMEIPFRTGSQTAAPLGAPELGDANTLADLDSWLAVGSSCPDVIRAQGCFDTGPEDVYTVASRGPLPLAWLAGEKVLPARCRTPQFVAYFQTSPGCFPVRTIGPGGLVSPASMTCIANPPGDAGAGDAQARDAGSTQKAQADAATQEHVSPSSTHDDGGCNAGPRANCVEALALLLLSLLYRRRRQETAPWV